MKPLNRGMLHALGLLLIYSLPQTLLAQQIRNDNPLELIGSKMNFRGIVVKKACQLAVASEDQTVVMRTEDIKNLYKQGFGVKHPFELQLRNCDIAILRDVTITFQGNEDTELSGRLGVSGADRVAIALFAEKNGSEFLPLHEPSMAQRLSQGDNVLRFQARIEAHPSAIQEKNITIGPFQAVTHFTLDYQ